MILKPERPWFQDTDGGRARLDVGQGSGGFREVLSLELKSGVKKELPVKAVLTSIAS